MSKKPIKAIVWDLDGTLIHFKIDFIKARKEAIKVFTTHGVPEKLLSTEFKALDNVQIAKHFFKSKKFSEAKVKEVMEEANSVIAKIEYKAAQKATMVKGINKVLEFVKVNRLKQAIFTYNTKENAEISLEKVNLLHYFEMIVGRDNIDNPKPHPDHLNLICKNLSVNPLEILVIGDMERDIEAALNIGAHSILIYTKLSTYFESNMYKKADFIIKPKDIPFKLIEAIKNLI